MKLVKNDQYLLLIDKEAEIKENDILYSTVHKYVYEVKSIERNRLIWYEESYKIIGYRSRTDEAKELNLPLLPPFRDVDANVKTRNFNKQVKNPYLTEEKEYQIWERAYVEGFNDGLAQSKQFSLENIKKAVEYGMYKMKYHTTEAHEEFIQSLSNTQQFPKEFIPEYRYYYHSSKEFYSDAGFVECSKEQYESIKVEIPTCPLKAEIKTMTNSKGKQVLVGTYKY